MKIDSFKVEEWFNKYEHLAKYDLADTCVDSLSIDELFNIIGNKNYCFQQIMDRKLNYGDIHGSPSLKAAICSLYDNQKSENITVTHGAIGANQLVMLSIVEPKDKVVTIVPTYQQHYSIPKSIGANVELYFLKEENNWLPDIDELKYIVGNDTKLICINNPNNPTGSVMSEKTLLQISEIARKSNAYILCDEVYRGLEHNGIISKSIADIYEKGISTGSVSKVFSLAGLRLGWIAAPANIIFEVNHQREYNTISIGILNDYFATLAINNKDKIIKRNLKKINIGKSILTEWVNKEAKIRWVTPAGGTTAFIRYDLPYSSYNLCKHLQEKTGVMLLPGECLEYDKFLRIGYGNNPEQLRIALELFSEFIR